MKHDGKCERLKVVMALHSRMSLNIKEQAVLTGESFSGRLLLCFCLERIQRGREWESTYDNMTELASRAMSRVLEVRGSEIKALGDRWEENRLRYEQIRESRDGDGESSGEVIHLDFKKRKRINSSGDDPTAS